MTEKISAKQFSSLCEAKHANVWIKHIIRNVLVRDFPRLVASLDGVGDDEKLSKGKLKIDHVDLGHHYETISEANALISQAYSLLCDMHNQQTKELEDAGFEMDIPKNGGGNR